MLPSTEDIFFPLLQYLKDGELHTLTSSCLYLRSYFNLTKNEMDEYDSLKESDRKSYVILASTKFYKRVVDAVHYLRKARLLRDFPGSEKIGVFFISDDGFNLLAKNRIEIKNEVKTLYKKYRETKKI